MINRRYQKALPPDCFPRAAFKLADLLDELREAETERCVRKVASSTTLTGSRKVALIEELCASREEETVSVAPLSPESTEQFEIDWKSRHQKE